MRRFFIVLCLLARTALAQVDAPPRLHFAYLELDSLQLGVKAGLLAHCGDEFVRLTPIGSQESAPSRYLVPLSRFDPIQRKWVSRNCRSLRLGLANSANQFSDAVELPLQPLLEKRQPFSGGVTLKAPKWQPPIATIRVGYSLYPVKRNVTERIDDKLFGQIAWIRDHMWDRNYLFVFQPIAITVPGELTNGFGNYLPLSIELATALNAAFPYRYYLDIKANGKAISQNPLGILGKQESAGFSLRGTQALFEDRYVVITPGDVTLEDDTIRLDLGIDLRSSSKIRRPHIIGRSVVQSRSITPNSEVGIVGVSDRTIQIDSVVRPDELAEQIRKEPTSLKFGLRARFMILEIVRSTKPTLSLEDEPPLIEDDLRPDSDR